MGNSWLKAGAQALLAGAGLFVVGCTNTDKAYDSRPGLGTNTTKGLGPSPSTNTNTIPGTAGAAGTTGAGLASRPPLQTTSAGPRPAATAFDSAPRGAQPAVGMSTPTNPASTQPTYGSLSGTGAMPATSSQSQRMPLSSGAGAAPNTPAPLPAGGSAGAASGATGWDSKPIAVSTQSSPVTPTRTSGAPPMPIDDGSLSMPAPTVAMPKPSGGAVTPAVYNNEIPPQPSSRITPVEVPPPPSSFPGK
jgi:hypothetical protein